MQYWCRLATSTRSQQGTSHQMQLDSNDTSSQPGSKNLSIFWPAPVSSTILTIPQNCKVLPRGLLPNLLVVLVPNRSQIDFASLKRSRLYLLFKFMYFTKTTSSSSSSRFSRHTRCSSVPILSTSTRQRKAAFQRKATSSAFRFDQNTERRRKNDSPILARPTIKLPWRRIDLTTRNYGNPKRAPVPTQLVQRIIYSWTTFGI